MIVRRVTAHNVPDYPCFHKGDGYLMTTTSHYGEYEVWVCADCGLEVPLDTGRVNRLPDLEA